MNWDMLFELDRLKTFTYWKYNSDKTVICSAERMAKAGFYAVGGKEEPDLVKCFICSKELDGWKPADDPFDEHRTHASACPFVKLNKEQADIKVCQLLDLVKHALIKDTKDKNEVEIKLIQKEKKRVKRLLTALEKNKHK